MTGPSVGTLRHLFVLEAPLDVADDIGGVARSYVEIDRLWCAVSVTGMKSGVAGDAQTQFVTHRVTTRSRDGVTAGMRLVNAGHALLILEVADPDMSGRWLLLDCEERRP